MPSLVTAHPPALLSPSSCKECLVYQVEKLVYSLTLQTQCYHMFTPTH